MTNSTLAGFWPAQRGSARRFLATALLSGLVAALTACGNGEPEADGSGSSGTATTIRVGVIPATAALPVYVGLEEGIFEKHGLNLELTEAKSGADLVAAL